jgi:hypothetical protein
MSHVYACVPDGNTVAHILAHGMPSRFHVEVLFLVAQQGGENLFAAYNKSGQSAYAVRYWLYGEYFSPSAAG